MSLFFANRIYRVLTGPEVKVDIDILSEIKYWLGLNFAALLVALSENIPPVQHESIHQI